MLVIGVGGQVLSGQKAKTTENTMRLITLAIDQFKQENPLRQLYDNPQFRSPAGELIGSTFGPYPPYQLAGAGAPGSLQSARYVPAILEPDHRLARGQSTTMQVPDTLARRLALDMSGAQNPNISNYVKFAPPPPNPRDMPSHDDNRALYAYFAAFSPGVLEQIPDQAVEPLVPGTAEFINPTGAGFGQNEESRVDVFGFHDAWGVPFDYMLYVKLEQRAPRDGGQVRWMVVDRIPVLRSRGVEKEVAEGGVESPDNWIFSQPLPLPLADVDPQRGILHGSGQEDFGWARAVPLREDYQTNSDEYTPYIPEP